MYQIRNNLKNHKLITGLLALVIIVLMTGGIYQFNRVNTLNKLLVQADKEVDLENYDKAIALYEEVQVLSNKKQPTIQDKIDLARKLTDSKMNYEKGVQFQTNTKYLEAIENFKNVLEIDSERYNDAKKRSQNCLSLYISDRINSAVELANSKQYDQAISTLDEVLKLNTDNQDAKRLKTQYEQEIKETAESAKLEVQNSTTSVINNQNNKPNSASPNSSPVEQTKSNIGKNISPKQSGNGLWGYVDGNSQWALPAQYQLAAPFKNEVAPVILANGDIVFVDKNGKTIKLIMYNQGTNGVSPSVYSRAIRVYFIDQQY